MKNQKILFETPKRIPTKIRVEYIRELLKVINKRVGKEKMKEKRKILNENISKLEMSCLNYAESKLGEIMKWYDSKMVNLMRNVEDNDNEFIIEILFSENKIIDKICHKHERKLNPKMSEKIMNEIEKAEKKRDLLQYVGEVKGLKCRNCGSNRIAIDTKQTRASDEAETVYYTCAECQTKWRH